MSLKHLMQRITSTNGIDIPDSAHVRVPAGEIRAALAEADAMRRERNELAAWKASVATPGSAEEFAASDDPRCRDGSAACIDCLMRGDCLMSSAQRSAAAPERAEPTGGCGACGDACRSRGSCRLADESPRPAARPCRCGPDGCTNGGAA